MNLTFTLQDLPKIAGQILEISTCKTLLFKGELGAGKTTLIKEIVKKLGVIEVVSSPTFSIVNEYQLENGKLYHFDFYRIESEEEALDIGIEDYLDSNFWVLIEWPEKIQNLWPNNYMNIELIKNMNGSRTVNVKPVN